MRGARHPMCVLFSLLCPCCRFSLEGSTTAAVSSQRSSGTDDELRRRRFTQRQRDTLGFALTGSHRD